MQTTLIGQQRTLHSDVQLGPYGQNAPIAQIFSIDTATTNTVPIVESQIFTANSPSSTEGTTADPNASFVGTNGGTPMFAITFQRLPIAPPVLSDPLEAPPVLGNTYQGFLDENTITQGTLGNL